MKKTTLFLCLVLVLSSCVSLKKFSKIPVSDQELEYRINPSIRAKGSSVNYKLLGDSLISKWDTLLKQSILDYGKNKKKQAIAGIITTSAGTIGSIISPSLSSTAKVYSIMSVSIVGVITGAYQLIIALDPSPEEYVKDSYTVIGIWELSIKNAAAYKELIRGQRQIKIKYKGIANV
jgi:hypothetical protein